MLGTLKTGIFQMKDITETFSEIYKNDTWRGGSGPGSYSSATEEYRAILESTIKQYNIKSVLDYGCGDWQFSKLINWDSLVDNYLGVDVVPSVIDTNIDQHTTSKIQFQLITEDWKFPTADLIICKDVLQHLPNTVVYQILENMKKSSKLLLITNDVRSAKRETNSDCKIGKWRPIDLTKEPWNLNGEILLTKDVIKLTKQTILIKV